MAARVVQITDFHLFAAGGGRLLGVDTDRSFETVLETVRRLEPRPALILMTGDLSQDGSPESYARLARRVSGVGIPARWIPGNHDDPVAMARSLEGPDLRGDREGTVGNWHYVLLDTRLEGEDAGRLADTELELLERGLAEADRRGVPALVALHHPPFSVGSAWIDAHSPREGKRFRETVSRHPSARVVLAAHVHQEHDVRFGRVRYLTTPSTCFQFEPRREDFGVEPTPPGFRILDLHEDGSLETRVVRVPEAYQAPSAGRGYE